MCVCGPVIVNYKLTESKMHMIRIRIRIMNLCLLWSVASIPFFNVVDSQTLPEFVKNFL